MDVDAAFDEAEKTLTAKGYTKNGDYWEKDGKQLSLEIQVHEAFSELERVADVYVEQLQRFGINAVKVKLTGNTWGDNFNFGNFEAMSGWQTCGSIMEPYSTLRTMAGDPASRSAVAPKVCRTHTAGTTRNILTSHRRSVRSSGTTPS